MIGGHNFATAGRDSGGSSINGIVRVIGSPQALAPQDLTWPGAARGRSFAAARRHSVVVRALKVVIPIGSLLAVGIVAFGSYFDPLSRIPGLTLGPVSMQGSKIAMESPRLTGFRKDKRPYEVTATAAFQDVRKPNVVELKDMKARLAIDDSGAMAHLVSQAGIFDTSKEHLELKDSIRVWTERGEEILLRSASVDFKAGTAVSREPVRITTPTLKLDAEGLEMSDNGKVLGFTGRVRAQLVPGPGKSAPGKSAPGVARAGSPAAAAPSPKITQAEADERP